MPGQYCGVRPKDPSHSIAYPSSHGSTVTGPPEWPPFSTHMLLTYPWQEEVGLLLSLRSESVSTCQVPLFYQARWHVGIQKKTIFRLLPVRKSMTQILRVGGSWRKNILMMLEALGKASEAGALEPSMDGGPALRLALYLLTPFPSS